MAERRRNQEELGDDEALYEFWAFIERRRANGRPDYDLDDVARFREALDEFEAQR